MPSLTETLVELGLGERLVARTRYCIHPAAAVAAIPVVGGTKDVDLDALARTEPTHVVVNVDENRRELVDALGALPSPPVVCVTHPRTPQDVLELLERFGALFADEPGVIDRVARWRRALEDALAMTAGIARCERRVLYLVWRKPWMTVARDTYISQLLARVGWCTWPPLQGGESGAGRYPVVRGDEDWLHDIDEVLLSSEPFPFSEKHVPEARALCPRARVRVVDGERLSWYGTRTVAGLALVRTLAADDGPQAPRDNAAWRSSSR